jgi:hypothetical protein
MISEQRHLLTTCPHLNLLCCVVCLVLAVSPPLSWHCPSAILLAHSILPQSLQNLYIFSFHPSNYAMHYSLRLELPWAPGVNRRLIYTFYSGRPLQLAQYHPLPICHDCLVVHTYPILLVTCMIYSITVSLCLAKEINYSILFYSIQGPCLMDTERSA